MLTSEALFLGLACALYGAVIAAYWIKAAGRKAVFSVLQAGLVCHLVSAGIRWAEAGHPPIFGTYEATLAGSWFLLLSAFLAAKSYSYIESVIPWTALFALLHIAYGLTFNTAHVPLTISELSIWVDLHALFAWIAYGEYTVSFFLAGDLLLKTRGKHPERHNGQEAGVNPEILDELILKYLVLGFIFHTLMFALGSYYSSILYGKWWTWDPVDTLFLISWLLFGIIIHLRLFYGWKEERMARLVLIGMATILIGYWSLTYIPWATYHIFDIDLKLHG